MERTELALSAGVIRAGVGLEIRTPSDQVIHWGTRPPTARIFVRTERAWRSLMSLSEEKVADAYMNGEVDFDGHLPDILKCRQLLNDRARLASFIRFVLPAVFGQVRTNRRAIAKHYELDPAFYRAFLDPVWPAYSQGIFDTGDGDDLSAAIERKFEFATSSCCINEHSNVVEVGPGWGAYLRYVLPRAGSVTALCNSPRLNAHLEQLTDGNKLEIVENDFLSYSPHERFAALTMMGVLEHLPRYERVCEQIKRVLKPGGYAYLDASAAKRKYEMAPFIYKHVFPYNHSFLHLESFLKAAKKHKLEVVSLFDDSENYRKTITIWAKNLDLRREHVESTYGSYHFRRFRLYLWGSVHAFEEGELQCHRIVLRAPQ